MTFDFGVLPSECSLTIGDWTITDLPDQSATLQTWTAHGSNPDWVFPPLTPDGGASPVWHLPSTHRLTYTGSCHNDRQPLLIGAASFIIYLVGAIAGTQVQHAEWLVTERQHKRSMGMFVRPSDHEVELALAQGVRWFEGASAQTQRSILGTLFLHNRVPYYIWDWERFAWQYTVIDSAWRAARNTSQLPKGSTRHRERLECIRSGFGLKADSSGLFEKWVDARNDLLHEGLWGTSIPGHEPGAIKPSYLQMRAFGTLAVLAACGIKGQFLQNEWDSRSRHPFRV